MVVINHPLTYHGPLKPFGIMLHTTGGGIAGKASREGLSLLQAGIATYEAMGNVGPHFMVTPACEVVKFREPTTVAWHCSVKDQRESFLDGTWVKDVTFQIVKWWRERWPGVKNPSFLYPGASANDAYIGIEMIPTQYPSAGLDVDIRYDPGQIVTVAKLVHDLAITHGIDVRRTGRLVGHEDVNPVTRPGWDPGAYFGDWSWPLFWSAYNAVERIAL